MKNLFILLLLCLCACKQGKNSGQAGTENVNDSLAGIYTGCADNGTLRKPYDGFQWNVLTGAGLTLKVQSNENIRLMADPVLPGIVMVRNGDAMPHRLIQVFDLPDNNIEDVIKTLEKTDKWDKSQTCKFREIKSDREGVKRYVMVPDGDYAVKMEKLMKTEPVPSTCNGWGVGNSGQRFFEVHETNPGKAVFMEIGQDAPLYDENSIMFSGSGNNTGISKDVLYTMTGTVCIGHEVRSFRPEGSDEEFWIVDKTGTLVSKYDKLTNGVKNGKPVEATLRMEYNGKWDDGFAADYSGVFFVREIVDMKTE